MASVKRADLFNFPCARQTDSSSPVHPGHPLHGLSTNSFDTGESPCNSSIGQPLSSASGPPLFRSLFPLPSNIFWRTTPRNFLSHAFASCCLSRFRRISISNRPMTMNSANPKGRPTPAPIASLVFMSEGAIVVKVVVLGPIEPSLRL